MAKGSTSVQGSLPVTYFDDYRRELGKTATLHINVAEQHMGRIEDAHLAICHMLAFSFIDTES
jgi:hypothetical protein